MLWDALSVEDGNLVSGLDGLRCVLFDVGVDDNKVAHLAGTQFVYAEYAGCFTDGMAYGLHFKVIGRAVHEVVQRVPTESPAQPTMKPTTSAAIGSRMG